MHAAVVETLVHRASNSVLGVVIENKEGRGIVLPDRVVDCSGDGDVAFQAGCRYTTLPLEEVRHCASTPFHTTLHPFLVVV